MFANDEKMTSDPVIFSTPKDYNDGLKNLTEQILKSTGHEKIDGIAMGLPGTLNKEKSSLFRAPNLSGWNKKPLQKDLSDALKTEVFLENDCTLIGLGEAVFGAGKGHRIVVYMTISTGIGGARFVDGRVDDKVYGFEPGHQLISYEKHDFGTKSYEPEALLDLENLIGGADLEKRYGTKPSSIEDEKALDDLAKHLAYGLNNVMVFWSPDIIVLGGGLVLHNVVKIDKVKTYLQQVMKMYPELPQIVKGGLGDVGGLYGGLAFVKNHLLK